jgi:hypothetical protein
MLMLMPMLMMPCLQIHPVAVHANARRTPAMLKGGSAKDEGIPNRPSGSKFPGGEERE